MNKIDCVPLILGHDRDFKWHSMEHVDGENLKKIVETNKNSRYFKTIANAIANCFKALKHVHSKGAIFCDLKPGSTMIQQKGKAKLIDFGISCCVRASKKNIENDFKRFAFSHPHSSGGDGACHERAGGR